MEFDEFRHHLNTHLQRLLAENTTLYVTDTDKDALWATYLESFPPGTNKLFRKQREYDCSACRRFVKSFGNVVAIKNNKLITIWDFRTNATFQPVVDALAVLVGNSPVTDVFVTKERDFGTDFNHERFADGSVHTWHHMYVKLPTRLVTQSPKSVPEIKGEHRAVKQVFKRSLEEISADAIDAVLDLIAQKSLYKGEEWLQPLTGFQRMRNQYFELPAEERDNFCWAVSTVVGGSIGKIKNHSIGVLLTDISEGMDLDVAVKRYETIVAPTNYKRPKAIFTAKMVEQAQHTIADLGLADSLGRRFATIEDITINNILFADRDSARAMTGDVFAALQREAATVTSKQFSRTEEVPVEHFVETILPRVTGLEVLVENRHVGNLVSLIAPINKAAPTLFKWGNGFSWAYNGNITDSMKERVKAAGGNVEGVLRFSLQWNENNDNKNDFDAHCIEPGGNEIYFGNKGHSHPSTGMLDVDIIHPTDQPAVENISYTNLDCMREGAYHFFVHNYCHKGGRSGFRAQVEFDGQIYEFDYPKELRQGAKVTVAKVHFSRKEGFKILEALPSTTASRQVWGLDTNNFHPVTVAMYSPNYWDAQTGIGHRHYFFMLKGCVNDTRPNGFFNEFLLESLMPHKRVFEALGGKMRVAHSETQLSGLGFSATQRASVVCRLDGHTKRVIKVVF